MFAVKAVCLYFILLHVLFFFYKTGAVSLITPGRPKIPEDTPRRTKTPQDSFFNVKIHMKNALQTIKMLNMNRFWVLLLNESDYR